MKGRKESPESRLLFLTSLWSMLCERWTRSQGLHTKGSLASCSYPLPARKILSVSKAICPHVQGLNSLFVKPHHQGLMSEVSILKSLLHFHRPCFSLQLCLRIQGFPSNVLSGLSVDWPSLPNHHADDYSENASRNHETPWLKHRPSFGNDLNKENWTPKTAQPEIPGILIDNHLPLVLSE